MRIARIAWIRSTADRLGERLGLSGHVELARSHTNLLGLFAEWRFGDAFRLGVGQLRTAYTRGDIRYDADDARTSDGRDRF